MATLKFRFSLDKVINALAYFASQGIKDLTKMKAAKLLYLADRCHLFRYGRPITGDRYLAMDFGPVPEGGFQLINRLVDRPEVEDEARRHALERLYVYRGLFRQYRYPVLRLRTRPDLDVFSDSEVEALSAVVREFGNRPAHTLVDLTHEHRAYKRADAGRSPGSSVDLPYEFFFDDAPEHAEGMRALAEDSQEDRDFAAGLQRAGGAVIASGNTTGIR